MDTGAADDPPRFREFSMGAFTFPGFAAGRPFRRLAAAGLIAAGLAGLAAAPAAAQAFSEAQKAELHTIIRSYLLENPEILREVSAELEKRSQAEAEEARASVIEGADSPLFNSDYHAVVGNPQGAVTIVEFFDYNCGFCKRAIGDLQQLMKNDGNVRVILKDFPVLGENSVEAAKVAQAVKMQIKGDKFWAFHSKLLLSRGQVGKAQALAVARDVGVDMARLEKDMASPEIETGIRQSLILADSLNLTGTPSYVVGKDVVVGAVGYDALKSRVDNFRKCGKGVC